MTKREIFDKILEISAEVCNVESEEIMSGVRSGDVVKARTICVFWCDAAGFTVESLLKCTDRTNPNSINSITSRVEDFWSENLLFRLMLKEVGNRLLEYAHSIGEDFDIKRPINRLVNSTNKC